MPCAWPAWTSLLPGLGSCPSLVSTLPIFACCPGQGSFLVFLFRPHNGSICQRLKPLLQFACFRRALLGGLLGFLCTLVVEPVAHKPCRPFLKELPAQDQRWHTQGEFSALARGKRSPTFSLLGLPLGSELLIGVCPICQPFPSESIGAIVVVVTAARACL